MGGKVTMDEYADIWGRLSRWPSKRLEQIRGKIGEELARRERLLRAKQLEVPTGENEPSEG